MRATAVIDQKKATAATAARVVRYAAAPHATGNAAVAVSHDVGAVAALDTPAEPDTVTQPTATMAAVREETAAADTLNLLVLVQRRNVRMFNETWPQQRESVTTMTRRSHRGIGVRPAAAAVPPTAAGEEPTRCCQLNLRHPTPGEKRFYCKFVHTISIP